MRQVIAMHGWSGDSNTWLMWASTFEQVNGYGKALSVDMAMQHLLPQSGGKFRDKITINVVW